MKIEPCPFCGGGASLKTSPESIHGPGRSYVECDVCHARGSSPDGIYIWRCAHDGMNEYQAVAMHDMEAIRIWNIRNGDQV